MNKIIWNQNEVNIDNNFAFNIAMNVMSVNEDWEPMIIKDCQQGNHCPKWKDAIEA